MSWEVATFSIDDQPPRRYTMEPHSWKTMGFFSWPVCKYCGLVLLRNGFSKWCADKGCNHKLHAGYAAQRDQAGSNLQQERRTA